MKRFKKIAVIYDLKPGYDQALERSINLAHSCDAHLDILHIASPGKAVRENLAERERMLRRIVDGIDLPCERKSFHVHHGVVENKAVLHAQAHAADLIVAPDNIAPTYPSSLFANPLQEILRGAGCPVWIAREQEDKTCGRIFAVLDAQKLADRDHPDNHRILNVASSLAKAEQADLHLICAWDFEGMGRDTIASELPSGRYDALVGDAESKHRQDIADLASHVLGDAVDFTAVPLRGDPKDAIIGYANEQCADLLIVDDAFDGPWTAFFSKNAWMSFIDQSNCSVLMMRSGPERAQAGYVSPHERLRAAAGSA